MSSATLTERMTRNGRQSTEDCIQTALGYPLRVIGFWSAVILPFVILSLLVVGVAQHSPELLTGLLGANVAGLVVGRNYKR